METIIQHRIKNSPSDCSYYNELAYYYLKNSRPSLALFCFTESLRINPEQNDIFENACALFKYSHPIIPTELKPDSCFVSVIMRTYNRLDDIRESIQSVLSQTIHDFELIVINDGGLEEIKNIVDSFSSKKIKYFRLPTNKGQAGAFNAGLLKACGKYIAYLDDDDVYYSDHLEKLTSFLESYPEYDCVYSNTWWCYGEMVNGSFVEQTRKLLDRRPRQFDRDLVLKANYITTLSLVFRRSCIRKAGLFNEDFRNCEDKEHFLRLSLHCKFFQIDDITGEYRWKKNNTSNDSIKMWFMGDLLFKHYNYKYLSIIKLKAALNNGQTEQICKLFNEILPDLSVHISRHSNIELLFRANLYLAKKGSHSINTVISEKYLQNNALKCVKALLLGGELKSLLILSPRFLKKVFLKVSPLTATR